MLSESEIRKIIVFEKDKLKSINDPAERKIAGAFIAGLECALND